MESSTISLIIMGICVVLFVTEVIPTASTAMFGCVAMVAFKVASMSDVLSGFTGDILLIIFGMQIMGDAMFTTGAANRIGKIAVKLSNDNEQRFIFISCLIAAILSAFLSNTAVVAMMLAICNSVVKTSDNIKLKNVAIPVAIAAIFGGNATLVGSTPQLIVSGILKETAGQAFGVFDLAYVGVPLTIIMLIYVTFIGYPLGKKIWGNRDSGDEIASDKYEIVEVEDDKKSNLVLVLFGIVIFLFISGWVPIGIAAMIGALGCILTGAISQKEAFKRMDWNTVIWLCCTLGLGNALNISGAGKILANQLFSLIGGNPSPMVFFGAVVLIALLISLFMANTTAVVIILPPAMALAMEMGLDPYVIAYGLSMGASLTFATPLANGFIGYTVSAGYKFMDYVKYGLLLTILTYICIVILAPILFPLIP